MRHQWRSGENQHGYRHGVSGKIKAAKKNHGVSAAKKIIEKAKAQALMAAAMAYVAAYQMASIGVA